MEIIRKWLTSGKNFHVGVAIYKTLGNNDQLKILFAQGKTAFAEQALLKELSLLLTSPPAAVISKTARTEVIPESTDSVLKAIRNEWLPKYQRMNYLRHELDKFKGNAPSMVASRKPIATEILTLEKECNNHWEEADEYVRNGKVPTAAPEFDLIVPEDPLERAKSIENAKRNIRRNRQQMTKHPDKPAPALLYDKYRDFYFRLTGNHYQENA
jgi:hypothetical protein